MTPTGATRTAAVIGDPVRHSFSPALHNAAFEAVGLDWVYVALEVAAGDGGDAVTAMRTLALAGLSVTMPHKAAVAEAADSVSPAVAQLGAANCLSWRGTSIHADNTDVAGFIDGLRDDAGFDPEGSAVALVGAGGAAKACLVGLADAGARSVAVINRNQDNAAAAVALAPDVASVASSEAIAGADLVVNATSVGMAASPGIPFDPTLLRSGQTVVDLIYAPLETELLAAATACGAAAHNGLAMLLHQAAHAFTIWTGEPAPLDAMRAVLSDRFG